MKCVEHPVIGDKHKTNADEGGLCLQKRLAYDLEPLVLEARQHEMRKALVKGDKHKTSADEGGLCLLKRLTYDLEPLAPEAGHNEMRKRLDQPRQA